MTPLLLAARACLRTESPIRRRWIRSLLCGSLAALFFAGALRADDTQPVAEAPAGPASEPAAADNPVFDVWEYQVSGSTRLPATEIERAVYPFLGPGKTIDDVEAARAAVETRFRDRGYGTVMVVIPEQDVNEGFVTLEVVEGRVASLRVTGSRYFSLGRIKSRVPALAPGQVPDLPEVQKQLASVNKLSADRRISPVMRPGRDPGTVDIELKVDDKLPLHGEVQINDDFVRDTTRTRLNMSLRYDNLWQREHSLGVAWQVSPEDINQVQVLSGTYLFRPDLWDLLVALYGVRSDSDVTTLGGGGGDVGVIGRGVIGGVRVIKPLPTVGSVFQNLTVGLDYKSFEDTVSPTGGTGFATPISYTKFVTGYSGFVIATDSTLRFNIDANFGVHGLGNTEKEFENKRFQAKPGYLYLRGEMSYDAPLIAGARYLVTTSGQIGTGPIIANEQFALGGSDTVRGYLQTQALLDNAVQGRLELQSPGLQGHLHADWLSRALVLVFVDAGHGEIVKPLPNQPSEFYLASTGFGFRVDGPRGFSSVLDWALPLIENGDIDSGESRLHFRFGYEF